MKMTELSSVIFLIWLIPVTVFIFIPLSTMCVYHLMSVATPLFQRVPAHRVDSYAREEIKAA